MDRRLEDLVCPKCGGTMRARERRGVVIDLCSECRGVFLDRGELDRLLDLEAEATALDERPPLRTAERTYRQEDDYGYRRDDDDYGHRRDDDDDAYRREGYPRRRRGFLGDLLEGFGD